MSRWNKIQNELIEKALKAENSSVQQRDIGTGKVYGTLYFKQGVNRSRGVLLAGGISGNRYGLGVLAQRLADLGYFCLSIDLPSHYKNPNNFTVGELSEEITEAIRLMRDSYGVKRIAVVGHSLGAIGFLFSSAGYNKLIERNLPIIWNQIVRLVETESKLIKRRNKNPKEISRNVEEIERLYVDLKRLVLNSLKNGIRSTSVVTSYVLMAPPKSMKSIFPMVKLMRTVSEKATAKLMKEFVHKPAVKQIYKEGNIVDYQPSSDKNLKWQFFKAHDTSEFFDYFLNVTEAPDFLKLIENLSRFRTSEGKVSFFKYYQKKYILSKPKLFIYGTRDFFLRTFSPFGRRGIERFYESCGNAEIFRGNFSHLIMEDPKQQLASVGVTNQAVTKKIIKFLRNTL